MAKDSDLISLIKQQDEKAIRQVYLEHRQPFLAFASRYSIDQESVLDVYQDAVIALCEQAQKGKIDALQSSLRTYLFSIGKFMIYNKLKQSKQMYPVEDFSDMELEIETYQEAYSDMEVKQLQQAFQKLGERCREVLQLFYYQEKKLDDILIQLNYSNKDVLKSQKARCIKQLKDLIKS